MTITLEDFRGDWPLVFFYPADFTFVCPTEPQAPAALEEQFHAAGTSILAASTDSGFSHRAWFETDPRLAGVHYPVVADQSRQLSSRFGVLQDDGSALRGSFLIDPDAWFSGPFRGRQRKPARRRGGLQEQEGLADRHHADSRARERRLQRARDADGQPAARVLGPSRIRPSAICL